MPASRLQGAGVGNEQEKRPPAQQLEPPKTHLQMKKTILTLCLFAGIASGGTTSFLTLPANTENNPGKGSTSATGALTAFADQADGGYMFNSGGQCNTSQATGEGYLSETEAGLSLTLCPRAKAGGSGEALVLSGSSIIGSSVESFTLSITSSSSETITGSVALTLAVVQNDGSAWNVLGDTATGTLSIGSGATLTLELNDTHFSGSNALLWDDSYKLVAVIDNTGKQLSGNNASPYVLSGITLAADLAGEPAAMVLVPEPATAVLSMLALCGLTTRRRRNI